MTLCNRRDYARYAHVGVSGSGHWCSHRAVPRNHECCHWRPRHAVPRNHRCCHWRPRHALSPSNHVPSTIMNFPLLVPILILLSDCINSKSLFPVAILCTILHRDNTSFEVWYLHMIKERCWFSQINFFIEYFPHRINVSFLSSQFDVIHIHR